MCKELKMLCKEQGWDMKRNPVQDGCLEQELYSGGKVRVPLPW